MMLALQMHGPDGRGSWKDDHIGLGHQMMHITPESLDEQLPLHHAESRVALTANARLDNREELLESLGMSSGQSPTDSLIALTAYLHWGTALVDHLIGEFAMAIWDARTQQLHCITDPMGIRPFFYTEAPGQYFAFASEIEPLLSIEDRPAELNQRRLAMLGLSALSVYLEPEATCFKNIYRLPAASLLTVSRSGKSLREYWSPDHRQKAEDKIRCRVPRGFPGSVWQGSEGARAKRFPGSVFTEWRTGFLRNSQHSRPGTR